MSEEPMWLHAESLPHVMGIWINMHSSIQQRIAVLQSCSLGALRVVDAVGHTLGNEASNGGGLDSDAHDENSLVRYIVLRADLVPGDQTLGGPAAGRTMELLA
eukprot:5994069-Pyramimonas_sp.AAC.2